MARDEVLRSIKEAEEKTGAKLEKARTDASNITSKARGKAADLISSGLQAAEAEAQSTVDEARAAAMERQSDAQSRSGSGYPNPERPTSLMRLSSNLCLSQSI